jgi:hypothetical protein
MKRLCIITIATLITTITSLWRGVKLTLRWLIPRPVPSRSQYSTTWITTARFSRLVLGGLRLWSCLRVSY